MKFSAIKKQTILFLLAGFAFTLLGGCHDSGNKVSSKELQIYCFSAGKADAILLMTKEGTVLIDTGEKGFGKEIVAYLERSGIRRIDYLIITHFDKDHVGGAAKVLRSVSVGTVLQSNSPKNSDEYDQYISALEEASIEPVTVREVYSFTLGQMTCAVDPPRQEQYESHSSNNSSLIISVTYGHNRFLFAGDAQNERLNEFLSGKIEPYDFLKVPYHGHWQEELESLIQAVKPHYAVITSSDEKPEDEETLALLSQAGTQSFLTRTAAVWIICDGETMFVQYADQ